MISVQFHIDRYNVIGKQYGFQILFVFFFFNYKLWIKLCFLNFKFVVLAGFNCSCREGETTGGIRGIPSEAAGHHVGQSGRKEMFYGSV